VAFGPEFLGVLIQPEVSLLIKKNIVSFESVPAYEEVHLIEAVLADEGPFRVRLLLARNIGSAEPLLVRGEIYPFKVEPLVEIV